MTPAQAREKASSLLAQVNGVGYPTQVARITAALLAAHEAGREEMKEEAADACAGRDVLADKDIPPMSEFAKGAIRGAEACAAAIRALGRKP